MRSRRNTVLAATLAAVMAAGPIAVPVAALEPLTIGTSSLQGASLRLYGFVETDSIYDTTQSYNEEEDTMAPQTRNAATAKGSTATGTTNVAGTRGRDQMSVRNSRLGMELNVPSQDNGISAKGVFEMDLLGNQGANDLPGAAAGAQSESSFFNNPTARIRHAYVDVSKTLSSEDILSTKIGQTWSLLGWQPYYFPGEAVVLPGVGMLYRRFVQARVTDTHTFGDWTLESAADAAKPAEMNSGSPEWHGGLRVASTKYKGTTISGAGTAMVGLSAGVSAAAIPIRTESIGSPTGGAVAIDVLVPIIPSSDGKSRNNTLVWAAEGVEGSGVGGVEMIGTTFGVGGVTPATTNSGTAIDSGIAGINNSGQAELIKMRSYRTHLQYTLTKWSASVGYAQVEARNLDRFSNAPGGNPNLLWPKLQYAYVAAFYDAATWLRFGGEINQTKATFNDANNRYARNNRYQLSAYFMF